MKFTFKITENTDMKTVLLNNGFSPLCYRRIKDNKLCFVNDKYTDDYRLKAGDIFSVTLPFEHSNVPIIDKNTNIIYEDEYILVVNKEKNLAVMSTSLHYDDNLTGRVMSYFIKTKQNQGIHLMNRLDYETTGIVIFAKHQYFKHILSNQEFIKKYHCHVKGIITPSEGYIIKPIRKVPNIDKIREVHESGKFAKTFYRTIDNNDGNSYLDIQLFTGRTHQIRVHMSSLGHPLMGDWLYGNNEGDFDLVCYQMNFYSPLHKKEMNFVI